MTRNVSIIVRHPEGSGVAQAHNFWEFRGRSKEQMGKALNDSSGIGETKSGEGTTNEKATTQTGGDAT